MSTLHAADWKAAASSRVTLDEGRAPSHQGSVGSRCTRRCREVFPIHSSGSHQTIISKDDPMKLAPTLSVTRTSPAVAFGLLQEGQENRGRSREWRHFAEGERENLRGKTSGGGQKSDLSPGPKCFCPSVVELKKLNVKPTSRNSEHISCEARRYSLNVLLSPGSLSGSAANQ